MRYPFKIVLLYTHDMILDPANHISQQFSYHSFFFFTETLKWYYWFQILWAAESETCSWSIHDVQPLLNENVSHRWSQSDVCLHCSLTSSLCLSHIQAEQDVWHHGQRQEMHMIALCHNQISCLHSCFLREHPRGQTWLISDFNRACC